MPTLPIKDPRRLRRGIQTMLGRGQQVVEQGHDVMALVEEAHPRDLRRKRRGMSPKGIQAEPKPPPPHSQAEHKVANWRAYDAAWRADWGLSQTLAEAARWAGTGPVFRLC